MAHDPYESLRLELRRGSLVMAVLGALESEQYGYTLRRALEDAGMAIEESTLYPLLRRLESQGLLTSEWRDEDRRSKRFYRLSPQGRIVLQQLIAYWTRLTAKKPHFFPTPKPASAPRARARANGAGIMGTRE
jgi:PadR family transcriptional regulator, regulatory protein PadR